jgi:hypothetical protein
MWNFKADRFQIRDIKNDIAIGEFTEWDDAAEWLFNLMGVPTNSTLNGSHE